VDADSAERKPRAAGFFQLQCYPRLEAAVAGRSGAAAPMLAHGHEHESHFLARGRMADGHRSTVAAAVRRRTRWTRRTIPPTYVGGYRGKPLGSAAGAQCAAPTPIFGTPLRGAWVPTEGPGCCCLGAVAARRQGPQGRV